MQTHAKAAPMPAPSLTPVRGGLLQRKCACGGSPGLAGECDECRKKGPTLQRRSMPGSEPTEVPPIVYEVLRSPGQPLDAATRAFMEPRFGHDFSHVRVHTDARAAESSQAVNALAYTVGQDVVLGAVRYSPETSEGRGLLAHELTHTIQQGFGADRWAAKLQVTRPGDSAELEANAAAVAVAGGRPFGSRLVETLKLAREGPATPAPVAPSAKFPNATFTRFDTKGPVRCCKDRGRGECPTHLGEAIPGDARPQNGMNLVFSLGGHRPGIEYGFVQVIHSQQCFLLDAAVGGGWDQAQSNPPGSDDSPVVDATCPIPDARNEITMTDAPGLLIPLGSRGMPHTEQHTQRVNATDWVIARERPGPWQRISEQFQWHSVTRIRRNPAGNWELVPGANRIARGFTKIGGCPPPR